MLVHRFSAHQRNLRDDWFQLVETRPSDRWTDQGPMNDGESQSIRVRNKSDGMTGVAKPGPAVGLDEGNCRAAHEKLAFDLGHLAALPVAAVILWPAEMPAAYRRGRSISSWSFARAIK